MPHDTVLERLRQTYENYKKRLAEQQVNPDQIDIGLATELDDIRHEITGQEELRVLRDEYSTPYNVSSDMELEGIKWPEIYTEDDGQIASSSLGDTVLVTGIVNQIIAIDNVTAYKVTGTTQAFKFKKETGSSFATERDQSATSTADKETQGQVMYLDATSRLVIEVTTAVASSLIDWTISYRTIGFGTVWGQT